MELRASACCGRRTPIAFQLLQMAASGLLVKCNFSFYLDSLCIGATSITFRFSSTVVFDIVTCENIIVKSEEAPDTYRANKLNLTNSSVR